MTKKLKLLKDVISKLSPKPKDYFSHVVVGEIPARAQGGKGMVMLPVYRFIGWDKGKKYNGTKLREIRKAQALEAIKDVDIDKSLVVDLW